MASDVAWSGRRAVAIRLALAVAASLQPCLAIAAAPSRPDGFYVYARHIALPKWQGLYSTALAQDYIDGAAISIEWDALEPRENTYDWSAFDQIVSNSIQHGKKIALALVAGMDTPEWVYAGGVKRLRFTYNKSNRSTVCTVISQPALWQPRFIDAYLHTLADIAHHLKLLNSGAAPQGSAYDSLRIVKLSGINLTTEEIRIDAHPPGGRCNEPDTAMAWAQAGYRPALVLQAFDTIARQTARLFPNLTYAMAIIHKDAFPPIRQDGEVDEPAVRTPPVPDPMTLRLMNTAAQALGSHLLIQWNALAQFRNAQGRDVLPEEVLQAHRDATQIGWQLNDFMGPLGGSGCIYIPFQIAPCRTERDFQAILENGMRTGARYFEIQPPDAAPGSAHLPAGAPDDFAPALRAAHNELMAR